MRALRVLAAAALAASLATAPAAASSAAASSAAAVPAAAVPTAAVPTVAGTGGDRADYLALGDSVPFGFDPRLPTGTPADRYVGYPELAARRLRLDLTNYACPGQTASGFVSETGTDNGCRGFAAAAPLHDPWSGTQLEAASAFLRAHPQTRLVTLTIGANDLLLCRATTADGCSSAAELSAVLAGVSGDVDRILAALRSEYAGRLVVVTYYSTDYTDDSVTLPLAALNALTSSLADRYSAEVADGFTALALASAPTGGRPCAAGLLIHLTATTCDVHPSPPGAALLASRVVRAASRERAM